MPISKLKLNVLANFAGKGWAAIMGLAFVPFYIKFLGVEAYGLIGFYVIIQAVFVFLQFGLGTTLTREIARFSALKDEVENIRNLVRTLEIIYWVTAAIVGITLVVLAPLIAVHWIDAKDLSPDTVRRAVMLLAVVIAAQWPFSLYAGGLFGLQHQVLINVIQSGLSTVRGVGAVLILWLVSPTIEAFFIWQAVIGLLGSLLVAVVLWAKIPKAEQPPKFSIESLRRVWKFAAGVMTISLLGIALAQMDKVLLSGLLPLKTFGYYTIAGVVASSLFYVIGPIRTAVFPKFSELVAHGDEDAVRKLYHQSSQFMTIAIVPIAAWLVVFSKPLILLWTQDMVVTENTYMIASLLVIGTLLNGLLNLPFVLQLAYSWTKIGSYANLVALIVLVPMLYILVGYYGAIGAAMTWIILNAGQMLISVQVMHTRLLKGEQLKWYFSDIGLPAVAAFSISFVCYLIVPKEGSFLLMAASLGASLGITIVITGLSMSSTRDISKVVFSKLKSLRNNQI